MLTEGKKILKSRKKKRATFDVLKNRIKLILILSDACLSERQQHPVNENCIGRKETTHLRYRMLSFLKKGNFVLV